MSRRATGDIWQHCFNKHTLAQFIRTFSLIFLGRETPCKTRWTLVLSNGSCHDSSQFLTLTLFLLCYTFNVNAPRYDTYFYFLFTYIYIFPPPLNLHKSLTAKQQSATPHPNHSKPIFMCAFVLVIPGLLFRYFYYHQTDSREKHRLIFFNLFSHSQRHTRTRTLIYIHLFLHNNFQCLQPEQTKGNNKTTHTHTRTPIR